MADDLSPLAAALRDADKSAVGGAMTYGDWERFATAAREHLSAARSLRRAGWTRMLGYKWRTPVVGHVVSEDEKRALNVLGCVGVE